MSVTIPDVLIVNSSYTDLYAATGIAVGTPLLLQNKGTNAIYIQNKAFQPASSSTDGAYLLSYAFMVVEQGAAGAWAKGTMAKISVQEMN